MDALTFTVRIVGALAWPIVVGLILWGFRKHLGDLLDRIQQVKFPGGEVAFSEQLDRVEAVAMPPPGQSPPELEKVAAEAQLPPAYIVQQAWLRVKQAIDAVGGVDVPLPDQPTVIDRAYRNLRQVGRTRPPDVRLSPEDATLLRQLQKLRNEAIHSLDPNITVTDALRYKDLAEAMARRIEASGPKQPAP